MPFIIIMSKKHFSHPATQVHLPDNSASPPPSQVHLFPLAAMFGLCSSFLLISVFCQIRLEKLAHSAPVIKGMSL